MVRLLCFARFANDSSREPDTDDDQIAAVTGPYAGNVVDKRPLNFTFAPKAYFLCLSPVPSRPHIKTRLHNELFVNCLELWITKPAGCDSVENTILELNIGIVRLSACSVPGMSRDEDLVGVW